MLETMQLHNLRFLMKLFEYLYPLHYYYFIYLYIDMNKINTINNFVQLDQIAGGVPHLCSPLPWWIKVLHFQLLLPLVIIYAGTGALLLWYLILGDILKLASVHPLVCNMDKVVEATGNFPLQSDRGNSYILVAYHFDDNNILTTPIKNRTGTCTLRGLTKIHEK